MYVNIGPDDLLPDAWLVFGRRRHRSYLNGWFLCVKLPWKRSMYCVSADEFEVRHPRLYVSVHARVS